MKSKDLKMEPLKQHVTYVWPVLQITTSEVETCENERALWNIKAEQTKLLSVGGQYDEEVAPAGTSCCISGEPKPLAHLSQCVCVSVCLTFSNRVSSSLTSFWTSSISALKKNANTWRQLWRTNTDAVFYRGKSEQIYCKSKKLCAAN